MFFVLLRSLLILLKSLLILQRSLLILLRSLLILLRSLFSVKFSREFEAKSMLQNRQEAPHIFLQSLEVCHRMCDNLLSTFDNLE